jgi:DNA-binding CsgD family transcriptional regulator
MDHRAHAALEQFVRQTIAHDLDQVMGEVSRLRHELIAVRAAAGLPIDPPGAERREVVAAMRAQGLSTRSIALAVGVNRATVTADLRRKGVPRPAVILGLDGRSTRGPSAPGPNGSL